MGKPGYGTELVLTRDFSVTGAVAKLALDKRDYAPGEPKDGVSLVPKGMADNAYTGSWQYTEGKTEGVFTFYGQRAGSYEIRVFFDDPIGGKIVRARATFEVQ